MKISNRVKRNIALALLVIGLGCTIARVWQLLMEPASGKAWLELAAILVPTYFCFDRVKILQRRMKQPMVGQSSEKNN